MRRFLFTLMLFTFILALPVLAQNPSLSKPLADSKTSALRALNSLPVQARAKIDPRLLKQLLQAQKEASRQGLAKPKSTTFLVYLKKQATLASLCSTSNIQTRRQLIVARLQATAQRSQAGLIPLLESNLQKGHISRYKSYWIFNGFAVDGDLHAALELARRPEVAALLPNRTHQLPPTKALSTENIEWNITHIGADRVWNALGITGRGVVVANMDSGVDWTHPALQRKYRGYNPANPAASTHDYNWFDATGTYPNAPGPTRPHVSAWSDHGTHTMGIILGSTEDGENIVGVAPGAQWIAVKVFDDNGETTDEWIHAGFQWILAPTDLHGENPDPSKAPDIVNNSWGSENGWDSTFYQDLLALQNAGILTVWAAGNSGPSSQTINAPASFPHAFAVGAVDAQDEIAPFSSRGPSPWGEIKPEVVAPGVNIRSTIAGGLYGVLEGTSMATPHVAGLMALIQEASNHTLSIEATEYIITSTAKDLGTPGEDNDYGYGLIDAFQAVSTVFQGGTFRGCVRDAETGAPIGGATIIMRNLSTGGQARTTTASDGTYSFSVATGFYDVTASHFGYFDEVAHNIEIKSQMVTQLDFALTPQPKGVIRGQITCPGSDTLPDILISVLGTPLTTQANAQGFYSLTVPVGTYTLRIRPLNPGYRGIEVGQVHVRDGANTTVNSELLTAPKILLVDADAWLTSGQLRYYQSLLNTALYGYDERLVRKFPTDNPSVDDLRQYDIVIWVQPLTSPGYINAWDALGAYLDQGGKLLISGQDIGYWDWQCGCAPQNYAKYLHASYLPDDGGLGDLLGTPTGPLAGIRLSLNTNDSARNQNSVDLISATDAFAQPILRYESGEVVGLYIENCQNSIIYLSFGLEGIGPTSARQQAFEKLLTLLSQAKLPHTQIRIHPSTQGVLLGHHTSYALQLVNQDTRPLSQTYRLSADSAWPAWFAQMTNSVPITQTRPLSPCEDIDLRLMLEIPLTAAPQETHIITAHISPQNAGPDEIIRTVEAIAVPPWQELPNPPTPRSRLSGAALGCSIYTIGGYYSHNNSDTVTNVVEILDLVSGTWYRGSPKPSATANSGIALLDGQLYLLGGYSETAPGNYVNTVEIYDPAEDQWSSGTPLPIPLSGMATAVLDGKIYIFGGNSAEGASNKAYVYDPYFDQWTRIANIPGTGVAFAQAVSLNGAIYLAGGWPEQKSLLRYDPQSDSWTILQSMHQGRHSFAMATDGRHIFVAGGGKLLDGLASVERYDPLTNRWTVFPSLHFSRRTGAIGVYADGKFYVIGGIDQQSPAEAIEFMDIDSPLNRSRFLVNNAPYTLSHPGDILSYTLTLNNPETTTISASWQHTFPSALNYLEGSITGGAHYNPSSRTLSWEGSIPPQGKLSFSFLAQVQADTPSGTTVTSTVLLDNGGCAPLTLSTHAYVALPSLSASTKQVNKARVAPGDTLHYSVAIINDSPYTIPHASLIDPIPTYTTYISGSVVGGTYNPTLKRIEWEGSLPPGTSDGVEEPSFNWIDATGGTSLNLGDDSCVGPLDLGFNFEFYGQSYSQIYVNSNGMILFEKCNSSYSNVSIPRPEEPNAFIAPFWDDLRPGAESGKVYMATFGQEPNRYAVIEWHQVYPYGESLPQTFEVILYEGTNRILFQYLKMTGDRGLGSSATVGIENQDGSKGVLYLFNGSPSNHSIHDGLLLEMKHSSTRNAVSHIVSYDVRVNESLPPLTTITNTAWIDDGFAIHQRTVTSTISSPSFATSRITASPETVLAGGTITFTVHLINTGDITSTNTSLVIPLPPELSYLSGSLQGAGATYNEQSRQIEWHGTVPLNPSGVEIRYQANVTDNLPINTWITQTATVFEQGRLMNTLQTRILVNSVGLVGEKISSSPQVLAGSSFTYTITVSNAGLYLAPYLVISDPLPSFTELITGTLEGGTYNPAERTILWNGALASREGHVLQFQVYIPKNTPNGTCITNTAFVHDSYGPPLLLSSPITVKRGDLCHSEISSQPTQVLPGGTVTHTIRLTNTGDAPIGATVSCKPPSPLMLLPSTLYASSGEVNIEQDSVHWQGTVLARGLIIIRFTTLVPPRASVQTVNLEAFIEDEGGLTNTIQSMFAIRGASLQLLPLIFR
ncbi:MAG: S8 family serine peptidase [Anaerolineae bacterium]|nr:S8 family serine peptidase [Anaerolineae bacterium]